MIKQSSHKYTEKYTDFGRDDAVLLLKQFIFFKLTLLISFNIQILTLEKENRCCKACFKTPMS